MKWADDIKYLPVEGAIHTPGISHLAYIIPPTPCSAGEDPIEFLREPRHARVFPQGQGGPGNTCHIVLGQGTDCIVGPVGKCDNVVVEKRNNLPRSVADAYITCRRKPGYAAVE
jgi:hypothetical protein